MSRTAVTIWLVVIPAALNWTLAISAFFINYADFKDANTCYLTTMTAFVGLCTTILAFLNHDVGPQRSLATAVLQGGALLLMFGGIYRGHGLLYGGQHVSLLGDWQSSLYFSIVTWTTLGYGDFTPTADLRLVAGVEALLGYTVFGTAVGLGTYLLCTRLVRE